MKIVLAASIFPPEIGGPATYAAGLKESLEQMGHHVQLEVFSALKGYPSGVRHLVYTWRLFRAAGSADAVIAFDPITTGLPAAIVHLVRRTPTIARIGGDFIWERHVERTGSLVPLPRFYEDRRLWSAKDRALFRVVQFVLGRIDVAFSSEWQKDIWQKAYALRANHVHIVENAIPPREAAIEPKDKHFLHYGRALALKNTPRLRRAIARVQETQPDIEIEEGALPQEKLLERIKSGYTVALPSISDVTPNYILDAIRFGKPFLLTKYSGYAERFKAMGAIVDPESEEDIVRGVRDLLDHDRYVRMCEAIAAYTEVRTYERIALEFLTALKLSDGSLSR